MKVVSAYKPFIAESAAHRALGPFDWVAALQMLRASVTHSCGCQTFALTDLGTALPVPTHHYATRERRLMLWILEVCLCYLRSDDFDDDTVMISPDLLVFADLGRWFRADLGVVVRPLDKYVKRPLLNQVQFWRHAAQVPLAAFYREALAIARTLPAELIEWGADTTPLVRLLSPLVVGPMSRAGLSVYGIDRRDVLAPLSTGDIARLDAGRAPARPPCPIVDFKYLRKKRMAQYFAATFGVRA